MKDQGLLSFFEKIYTALCGSAFKLFSYYETITHRSVEEYIHNWKIKNSH